MKIGIRANKAIGNPVPIVKDAQHRIEMAIYASFNIQGLKKPRSPQKEKSTGQIVAF